MIDPRHRDTGTPRPRDTATPHPVDPGRGRGGRTGGHLSR
ncbi:hypothetical protein Ae505Ps2_3903 [Pseudonocardia sp. Ae505_Ps2]|nr:hypothetical protein Ae505Ps2_3903 [Pseudonocardia sp. Ae505_Ps2]